MEDNETRPTKEQFAAQLKAHLDGNVNIKNGAAVGGTFSEFFPDMDPFEAAVCDFQHIKDANGRRMLLCNPYDINAVRNELLRFAEMIRSRDYTKFVKEALGPKRIELAALRALDTITALYREHLQSRIDGTHSHILRRTPTEAEAADPILMIGLSRVPGPWL